MPRAHSASVHMVRHLRTLRGETVADIAKAEGVSVKQVERSLRRIELDRALNTREQMDFETIRVIRESGPEAQEALRRAFHAKAILRKRNKKGEEVAVLVDDHERQLEAVEMYKELVTAMQPRGNGFTINNQANANAAAAAATTTNIRTEGFEERLKRLRKQQTEFAALPSETIAPPDADDDYDDDDEEDEDEDEDEETGE